jgi:AraC family transcriptional regulator of adaptative response / DNA-3-methyladenine glycosylase II
MEMFGAVATTGIYCRPGSGGRPGPENADRFAAAAAGHRACAVCRPCRLGQPAGWNGPELACRAVRMIVDGALDGGTEAALGARLGISGRHLRRLFLAHVGATPDQVARSCRAHFARRLLDDTEMSITEITFAAGFGSLRQLNRSFKEVFRATPRELRARGRASGRLATDGGLPLRLSFRGPFDWEALTRCLAAQAIPGVEHVSADCYRRTVIVDGDPGMLELLPGGTDYLMLRVHLPHWAGLLHIVSRARQIAGLDDDLAEPSSYLAADPLIGPLIKARPGVRAPGSWDPFEAGVRAILGQQKAAEAAAASTAQLVRLLGGPVPGLGELRLTHTFPSPEAVAEADPARLAALGLGGPQGIAMRSFAAAVASRQLRLDRSVGLDQLIDSLTVIEGIGARCAHYIALRLGERDAFPVADIDLGPAIRGSFSAGAVGELGRRCYPWRALAATHLWIASNESRAVRSVPAQRTGETAPPRRRCRRAMGGKGKPAAPWPRPSAGT